MGKSYQPLLLPVLWILSRGYVFLVRGRVWLYAQGWLKRSRLPRPVLSVGNVTVGGTGKTPTTLWVAQELMNRGLRVGILSRGYRRAGRDRFVLVSDGRTVLVDPSESGDEPLLLARCCPGAVVAVGADRYRLGQWVLRQEQVDCFILDDGFQHLSLQRDVDLVLIDVSDSQGLRHLLPMGLLREPLDGLVRATTILLTRCDNGREINPPELIRMVMSQNRLKVVTSRFMVEGLVIPNGQEVRPATGLKRSPVLIFSGVANPSSFRRTVETLGVEIVDEVVYRDHYAYKPDDLVDLVRRGTKSQAECFLTTEKDLVKIESEWSFPQPLYAVRIGLQVCEGEEVLESCLQTMVRKTREMKRSGEHSTGMSV